MSFTVDNPSSGSQKVTTITLVSVDAYDTAANATLHTAVGKIAGCGGTNLVTNDFSMPDVSANQDFANGNGQTVTAHGTLTMNDLSSNQDACKGRFLVLNLTSS